MEDFFLEDNTLYKKYLKDLPDGDILTKEEEILLAEKIHQGDELALKKFLEANLRLVISRAMRYIGGNVELMDLISEGNIGLHRAILKFDPSRGNRFASYAVYHIDARMLRALYKGKSKLYISGENTAFWLKFTSIRNEVSQQLGKTISNDELAEEIGISSTRLKELSRAHQSLESFDCPFSEDSDGTLYDTVADTHQEAPFSALESDEIRQFLLHHLSDLSELNLLIITQRYGLNGEEPKSQGEIGESLTPKLSKQAVSIREQKIIIYLRNKIKFSSSLRALES